MMHTRIYYCAVPKIYWVNPGNDFNIYKFAKSALICERRISKGVNLENEVKRYTLLCRRIGEFIMQTGKCKLVSNLEDFKKSYISGNFPLEIAKPGYLPMLSRNFDFTSLERLGSNFFIPEQVGSHRKAFLKWACQEGLEDTDVVKHRSKFFEWAELFGCGVMELQSSFFNAGTEYGKIVSSYATIEKSKGEGEEFTDVSEFANNQNPKSFSQSSESMPLLNVIREQIKNSLYIGEPFTIKSGFPYQVIIEALNEYVFFNSEEVFPATELRIVYSDGSEGLPFPLFCLPRLSDTLTSSHSSKLKVGLISNRYQEVDPLIDFYWFRNREVVNIGTYSEIDKLCYETTLKQLQNYKLSGSQSIDVYFTGLIPAIVGFYRGVVHMMVDSYKKKMSRSFSITPFYYKGKAKFQTGSIWQ